MDSRFKLSNFAVNLGIAVAVVGITYFGYSIMNNYFSDSKKKKGKYDVVFVLGGPGAGKVI